MHLWFLWHDEGQEHERQQVRQALWLSFGIGLGFAAVFWAAFAIIRYLTLHQP